jgi:hypothetical protein
VYNSDEEEDRAKMNMKIEAKIKRTLQFCEDKTKCKKLIIEHLDPCGDDLILLTLKGHCIIESFLESILVRQLNLDALPQNHVLEFSQKLGLVKAVVIVREPKPNADLFCAITKLNSIRNRLAHNLINPLEIEAYVKSIIESYQSKADLKLSSAKSVSVQLRNCIVKLCEFLFEVIDHFYKLDLKNDES